MPPRTRRAVLTALAGATLAGCSTGGRSGPPDEEDLPAECPITQNLDVEWPRPLDKSTAEEFVRTYENTRLNSSDTDRSRFHSASYTASIEEGPTRVQNGFKFTLRASGEIYSPNGTVYAFKLDSNDTPVSDIPFSVDTADNPTYVSSEEIENTLPRHLLTLAAESGTEFRDSDPQKIEQYAERMAKLSPDASLLPDDGGTESAYFDVEGTPVLLVIRITRSVGDAFTDGIQYYVSEWVVRRTVDTETEPTDGELLECRLPE